MKQIKKPKEERERERDKTARKERTEGWKNIRKARKKETHK